MRTHADYRKLAEDCARLAQTTSTPRHRCALLQMANTWLYLADQVGSDGANGVEDRNTRNGEQLARAEYWWV